MVKSRLMTTKIPQRFQAFLWSQNISNLNINKNKIYIIHQLLAYGGLDEYLWLFKTYGKNIVRKVFATHPEKDYYNHDYFNFIKLRILNINDDMDERYYCKEFPRIMKPYIPPKLCKVDNVSEMI